MLSQRRAATAWTPERCEVCGQPLGAESWWVTAHPSGAHTRCIDWSARPFPFARQLEDLRKAWRRTPALRDVLLEPGRWLAAAAERWPAEGAEVVLEASRRLNRLRGELRRHGPEGEALARRF